MTIAAVAVVAGVGSFALWSDSEVAQGNQIVAGKLDLLLSKTQTSINNVYPGATGTVASGTLKNNGSINGNLTMKVPASSIQGSENGLAEPEQGDDAENGELCPFIQLSVKVTRGEDTTTYTTPNFLTNTDGINLDKLVAGETIGYEVMYEVSKDAQNNIMTDKCRFDIDFMLSQVAGTEL